MLLQLGFTNGAARRLINLSGNFFSILVKYSANLLSLTRLLIAALMIPQT